MSNIDLKPDQVVVTKLVSLSVDQTVERLEGILAAKQVKVFAIIDQAAEALAVGLRLRQTTLVMFGNPRAGTPVMEAAPLAALDLPLKVLVWDDGGQSKVSYYSPASLTERHRLPPGLANGLQAIDAITDELISRT